MVEPSTSQPDDSPLKPMTRSFTDLSISSGKSNAPGAAGQRKLPPPYDPNSLPMVGISRASTFGASPSTPGRKPLPQLQHRLPPTHVPHHAPSPSDPMLFSKKPPPQVPQKPSGLLQAPLVPDKPAGNVVEAPPPPPPRRKPAPSEETHIPPLPPRGAEFGGIMDNDDTASMSSLSWEPLKPR